jgi:hypothetical protein
MALHSSELVWSHQYHAAVYRISSNLIDPRSRNEVDERDVEGAGRRLVVQNWPMWWVLAMYQLLLDPMLGPLMQM